MSFLGISATAIWDDPAQSSVTLPSEEKRLAFTTQSDFNSQEYTSSEIANIPGISDQQPRQNLSGLTDLTEKSSDLVGVKNITEGSSNGPQEIILPDGGKVISIAGFMNGAPVDSPVSGLVNPSDLAAFPSQLTDVANNQFEGAAIGDIGDDLIYGSSSSDLISGNLGNDTIFASGGNDLVRPGDGSDLLSLGEGNDTIYYAFDDLQNSVDTVSDFDAAGIDKLAVQADRVGGVDNFGQFGGFGTNSLTITDADGSVTTVVASNNYLWKQTDIFFVV